MITINFLSKPLLKKLKQHAAYRVRYAKLKKDPKKYAAHRARVKAWRKANPEAVKVFSARSNAKALAKNPDYFRDWANNNREKMRAYERRCRAKKKASQGRLMDQCRETDPSVSGD